jgi:high-affinity Fe2+/Pb2+ permease
MMTKFSIFMMILFLFCGYGANNGGGTFAFIEVLMAMSMDDNEKLENLVLLFAIAGQIAGIYAIIRSNSRLMLWVIIALSLVVIVVTAASADAIGKVIWVNSLFVVSSIIYVLLHFKNRIKVQEGLR